VLVIHRSERADGLVDALGRKLNTTVADPFAPEVIAVPSRGVERWLAQRLSHVLGAGSGDGVCANVVFPAYGTLLDEAASVDPGYAESVESWAPARSVWPLLSVIDASLGEAWCRVLAAHLAATPDGEDTGRRFAVASKLARLFDGYGRSRPEMVEAWASGRDEQGDGVEVPADLAWQPELWRRLRDAIAVPAPAQVLDSACAAIGPGPALSVFGATRIAPSRVRILAALARERDVDLWIHHPSPALWDAVRAAGEGPGPRRSAHRIARNPLLASMSRDVRELQQLLAAEGASAVHTHHPIAPRPQTLLGRLQSDLAEDAVGEAPHRMAATDRSVVVHAAHGPARQVEVLRDAILGMLREDPTLEPRDIVIMCPDVETYAPLIGAAFGMPDHPGAHPAGRLRVSLADRSLQLTNPLLRLLGSLLELARSRVTATAVLDLAGSGPVRRRFSFDGDDIERLRTWTVEAGARWGLDAEHRGRYKLSGIAQGTWRGALDRVLLGVAMEEGEAWVGDTLPLDDVDSGDIDLAGRFGEFLDRVDGAVVALGRSHRMAEWTTLLAETTLALGDGEAAWQVAQLRRELDELAADAGDTDVDLGLADIAALVASRLRGRPTRANFRTGTLTVCTLVPMRSVPHRVVCLLGMDDGRFPRNPIADGDDVLARDPRTGERDPRSEDRQLFLDAICAATERLVITYTGANPRTGAAVPPCVPVGELLDAVQACALAPDGGPARDHVVVRHPLQPFDARNFLAGELGVDGPFSFDPAGLAGAIAAAGPRHRAPALPAGPLPPPASAGEVGLAELIAFLLHPARGFLRQRLQVATSVVEEEPVDAMVAKLEPLQQWAVGDRLLRRVINGTERSVATRLEFLRGELPPGPLGVAAVNDIGTHVGALLRAAQPELQQEPRSVDLDVALPDGRRLTGTVNGLRGSTIFAVSYSKLAAKHRLAAWVRYLAVCASGEVDAVRAVTLGRNSSKQGGVRCSILASVTPGDAARVLELLVSIRDSGLCEPLPMALATSAEYAFGRHGGQSRSEALDEAGRRWAKDEFAPEQKDREHVLVYGPGAPLTVLTEAAPAPEERFADETTRFGALARLVWEPLLTVESMPIR
jgi:exodeoxyribonuclease V gamma subunit